jgi:trimeric autotransporter adhesin
MHTTLRSARTRAASRLLAAIALLGTGVYSVRAATSVFNPTAAATYSWGTAGNWSLGIPTSADDAQFGAHIGTGNITVTLDAPRSISRLVVTTASTNTSNTLSIAAGTGTPTNTLTIGSGGISYQAGSSSTISAPVVLGSSQTWDISPSTVGTGSAFAGLTVSGIISDGGNVYSITKSGSRALTLTGNNTFSGGVTIKTGQVLTGSFTNSNAFGSGIVTLANEAAGANNAINSVNFNSGFTSSFANEFINNNASATNVASFSIGSNTANFTQTFSGKFSTGANYNSAQFLNIAVVNGSSGTQNGTFVFSGDWSEYSAGAATNGIRISGGGNVVLNAAQSIAPTNYALSNNSTTDAAKLILGGAYTMNRAVSFIGSANGMRNSFGTQAAASTTTTLAGDGTNALVLTDTDGANIFAQNTTSTLAVTGLISGAGNLRINDGYTFVSGSTAGTAGTNTLQTPTGIVNLSGANTNSGGVTVSGGTLLVTNTTDSATGSGAVTVGTSGAAIASQAGTGVITSRVLTGVDNTVAATLAIGQSISGTNIPANARIAGITIGASSATIVIDQTTTGAVSAFSTTSFSTSATLGGTGTISGATTINSASFLAPGLAAGNAGLLTFGSSLTLGANATTTFDINGAGRGTGFDAINVGGALVNGGSLVLNFTATLADGNYSLFTFGSQSGDFTSVTLTGLGYGGGSLIADLDGKWSGVFADTTISYTQSTGQLSVTAVPEPSAFAALAGLGALGFASLRRRSRRS